MTRSYVLWLAGVFLVGVFSASLTAAENFVVEARPNNRFSPANLTIQPGDSVTFRNTGGLHNVRATSGATFKCANGCDDTGGNGTASEVLWSFTRTFNTPGTIQYECEVHVALGMVGTIVIQASTPQQPGQVSFTAATANASEGDGSRRISVQRVGGADGAAAVDYSTSDGSASAGQDYTATSGTLTWADQVSGTKTFDVPILEDSSEEPTETVNLTLSNASGASLGSPSAATIRIADNDSSSPTQSLSFVDAAPGIGEGGGGAAIAVQRSGGTQGAVAVDYATSDGSAMAGTDYLAASGTLTWADGDGASKAFNVTVIDDAEVEGDEMINLGLSNPTGGATLGPSSTATLTVRDDDQSFPDCVASATVLCLGEGGRFEISARFDPPNAAAADAGMVDIGRQDSGVSFFFSGNNLELLIKVLNGCALNNHYWVFFAATTTVEFTLTVIDTLADQIRTYTNPQGQRANAITDTEAFATCP